jgi:hypothetical protein
LVGNANICPLPPDRTFSNIGFSTAYIGDADCENFVRDNVKMLETTAIVV